MVTTTDPIGRLRLYTTAFNPRSAHTVSQYERVARELLVRCQATPPSQDDVLRYIGSKEAQGYKAFCFSIVHRLFQANQWPWPFPSTAAPQVQEQRQVKLSDEAIAAMVQCARDMGGAEAFYAALSTVYGFRPSEMCAIGPSNLHGGVLQAQTLKHGELRIHRVPVAIEVWLSPSNGGGIGYGAVRDIFRTIARGAGLSLETGSGWHSIRRSLISQLSLTCPVVAVVRFMGWKGGRSALPEVGAAPKIVFTYARPSAEDVDAVIYSHHPYLKLWE